MRDVTGSQDPVDSQRGWIDDDPPRPGSPNAAFFALTVMGIAYAIFASQFMDLGCTWDGLRLDACAVFWAFIIVLPAYALLLWRWRREVYAIDLHVLYLPFLAWYGAFSLTNGKGMGSFLLELTCVGLLTGVYLLRVPIVRLQGSRNRRKVALSLLLIVSVIAVLIGFALPPLPE